MLTSTEKSNHVLFISAKYHNTILKSFSKTAVFFERIDYLNVIILLNGVITQALRDLWNWLPMTWNLSCGYEHNLVLVDKQQQQENNVILTRHISRSWRWKSAIDLFIKYENGFNNDITQHDNVLRGFDIDIIHC